MEVHNTVHTLSHTQRVFHNHLQTHTYSEVHESTETHLTRGAIKHSANTWVDLEWNAVNTHNLPVCALPGKWSTSAHAVPNELQDPGNNQLNKNPFGWQLGKWTLPCAQRPFYVLFCTLVKMSLFVMPWLHFYKCTIEFTQTQHKREIRHECTGLPAVWWPFSKAPHVTQ